MNGKTWIVKSGNGYIEKTGGDDAPFDPTMTSEMDQAERTDKDTAVARGLLMNQLGFSSELINTADPELVVKAFQGATVYLLTRANRERKLSHLLIGSEAYDKLIHALADSHGVALPEMACMRSPAEIFDLLVNRGRKP